MQKFQELLTQAAQLKQQQLKQQRKNFQALPQYLKSGLNYAKKYVQLRKQNYLVQKYISQRLKKQGNDQYLLQNYSQALSKYQQALSIFRYIHATKYQNLKDQDIIYQIYTPSPKHKQQHDTHLVALYLNICSVLTKMNKKDQAIHSSEQALKLNSTNPKIYYKKAQAYLQYINRQTSDIKVGFYYLNKAYQISKDQSILVQMHKIKKQLDQQRQNEKKWFKFMFDKNKEVKQKQQVKQTEKTSTDQKSINKNQTQNKQNTIPKKYQNPETKQTQQSKNKQSKRIPKEDKHVNGEIRDFMQDVKHTQSIEKNKQKYEEQTKCNSFEEQKYVNLNTQKQEISKRMKAQFQKFKQQNQQNQYKNISQLQKLQKTKLSLKPYLIIPRDDRWLIKYQEDYIHKHGSKIYSILQLYNYNQYLIEFKSLLAKCLELKQAKITPQRDQNKLLQQKISIYTKFIQWIKNHPIEKYKRYIQRYDLQTKWIKENRGKPLDQVYAAIQKESLRKEKPSLIKMDKNQNRKQKDLASRHINFIESLRQQHSQHKNNSEIKGQDLKQNKEKHRKSNIKTKDQQKQFTRKKQNIDSKSSKNKQNTYGFKQQWECQDDSQPLSNAHDQVPAHLKGFLQNYEDFPNSCKKKNKQSQNRKQQENTQKIQNSAQNHHTNEANINQEIQKQQKNPFGFVKTFLVLLIITMIGKLLF